AEHLDMAGTVESGERLCHLAPVRVLDTDENDPLHRQASFEGATTRPQQPGSWTHRHARTPAHAPRTGAVRYTHKLSSRSDTRAGARERAGFIDAPEIGPANSASKAITDPTATPARTPFSFEPVETLRMTNISRKVSMNSSTNDWRAPPAGRVAPSVGFVGNISRRA